jgi:hypothetical protein
LERPSHPSDRGSELFTQLKTTCGGASGTAHDHHFERQFNAARCATAS